MVHTQTKNYSKSIKSKNSKLSRNKKQISKKKITRKITSGKSFKSKGGNPNEDKDSIYVLPNPQNPPHKRQLPLTPDEKERLHLNKNGIIYSSVSRPPSGVYEYDNSQIINKVTEDTQTSPNYSSIPSLHFKWRNQYRKKSLNPHNLLEILIHQENKKQLSGNDLEKLSPETRRFSKFGKKKSSSKSKTSKNKNKNKNKKMKHANNNSDNGNNNNNNNSNNSQISNKITYPDVVDYLKNNRRFCDEFNEDLKIKMKSSSTITSKSVQIIKSQTIDKLST